MHFSDVYEKNLHRRMSFPVSDEDGEGVSSGNYETHDNLVPGPIISHDTI